jgi:hypothetical protein
MEERDMETVTLSTATVEIWSRIAKEAIMSLNDQVDRLRKERDNLEVQLAELMDHVEPVPEQYWRPVNVAPRDGTKLLLSDGNGHFTVGQFFARGGEARMCGMSREARFWMPIPKLSEEAGEPVDEPEEYEPVWISDGPNE